MARFCKISLLLPLLVLFAACVTFAGPSAPAGADGLSSQSPASNTTAPKAVFPQLDHHFDDVFEGALVKHDFVVENQGNAPLLIKNIRPG
jgi:hypothetical protein